MMNRPTDLALQEVQQLLDNKPPVERAVWYHILSSEKWKKDFTKNVKRKCRDYLLNDDQEMVSVIDLLHQNYVEANNPVKKQIDNRLDSILGDTKESIIQNDIVRKVCEVERLSAIPEEKLVTWANVLGALLAHDLKMAQIRRFMGAVLKVEVKGPKGFRRDEVVYLKVLLAYAAGRNKAVRPLLAVIDPMIDRIEGWEDFQQLVRFVRAVVAYHKFYGGNE
jgi:CRISPR type III-A/MTUBE-associated protein Csm2